MEDIGGARRARPGVGRLPGAGLLGLVAWQLDVRRTQRAHAVMGLINSTPRIPGSAGPGRTRQVLTDMARGALGVR